MEKNYNINDCKIFLIDALENFDANVDACLFYFKNSKIVAKKECKIFKFLNLKSYDKTISFKQNKLIANLELFQKNNFVVGKSDYKWRNGVKHDAAKVMELSRNDNSFINNLKKEADVDDDLVFPLLKSSDVANGKIKKPRKYVLVTQHSIGEDTNYIKIKYPKTWTYLEHNKDYFTNRKSSVYKNKPKYSIFSVGKYSFAKYKIVISGFYNKLNFKIVGDFNKKPFMLDDTCNFIPCCSYEEAEFIFKLLDSKFSRDYLNSVVFWDNKRAITTEILNSINLRAIAEKLKLENKYFDFIKNNNFLNQNDNLQLKLKI